MPDKKFTDFTLSTLTTGDFAVGYKANGSEEWRAPIKNILNLQVFPSVTGVFGRSGNVLGVSGDYSAESITNDSNVSAPTVKDALNVLKQSIFDTGAATVNSVNSVFGRQGTVVGQSGDYKDTGVTNTSSVAGGTVKDALETLKTTIAATGAATLNSVNSVFGRQGSVVANSGDYSGEYITNTSDVIGGTVTNALNTLNTRLGSTGNVLFNRDADISGYLYNLQTGFQADINSRLEQTGQSIETNDVDSVFGRIGVVVGQSGDYSDTGITNTSTVVAPTVKDALSLLDSRLGSTGSDLFNRDNSISGALNHYITGLEARIEQTGSATVNTVTSVFGRQGVVVGQSGDYRDTGITNTSLVAAPTVKDALSTLHTRLEATGALASAPVTSVFGRIGAVVGQTGDYQDTGITNTSTVVGDTVKGAFNTLNTRLGSTGALIPFDAVKTGDSSVLNNAWVIDEDNLSSNLDTKVPTQQSVKAYADSASPILVRTGDANVMNYRWVLDEDDFVSNSNTKVPTQQSVKAYADAIAANLGSTGSFLFNRDNSISGALNHYITGLEARIESTGSTTANTVTSVFGRQGVIVGQSGDYKDSGVTNTSNVVGGTVKDAFNSLNTRLEATGALASAPVTSVFGRIGVVVGQSGDYVDSGVTNTSLVTAPTVKDALSTLHTRLEATGGLAAAPVTSVFGRVGVVVGQSGDYRDTGITNTSTVIGGTVKDAFDTLNTRLGTTGSLIPLDAVKTGDASVLNNAWVLDEDNFVSDSNTKVPTQQSVKAYSDAIIANLGTTGSNLFNRDASISGVLNHYITGLEARIELTGSTTLNTVTSVFGRQGVVVGQSGDYRDTGITNTSTVAGGTVKDALTSLNTRLEATGSTTLNNISSVFGRIGVVVGQSGDYRDSGITNTSTVEGGTVKDALTTLNTRLEATGSTTLNTVSSVFGRIGVVVGQTGDYRDSGITNTSTVAGGTVKDALTSLNSRLEATGTTTLNSVTSVFGRQGIIVGQSGDYRDSGITNTSLVTGPTVKEALSSLHTRLEATGALASAPVSSVFGRVGIVVGQTGDYRDSGITNTSIVDGGTVKDALATLHSRLEATGALAAAPVSSVFGRIGVVVGQTGDYKDTGITNTSTVIGGTVKDAFDSLNIRLGETGILGVTSFKEGGLNYYYSGSNTGLKGFFFMPYTVDLIDYKMIGDITGDVIVGLRTGRYDLWEGPDTLASFCGNSSPRMINQRKNTSGDFSTSWVTGRINSGDILGIYIEQMTGTNVFDMNLNWKRIYF